MTAGSGPYVVSASGVAISNSEVALVTAQNMSWQETLGILLSGDVYVTGSATGSITFRFRQGVGTGGANVGPAGGFVMTGIAAASTAAWSMELADTSAFAQAALALSGAYTLTALGSVSSVGTATYAALGVETIATIQ